MIDAETGITIVCCEHDKRGIEKPIIYVVKRNADDKDISHFWLRSIFNPELEYYATAIEGDDDFIVSMAKAEIINSEKANVISYIRNIKSIVKEYDKITIIKFVRLIKWN